MMGMAVMMAIFGAIYHWFPKATGRMYNELLGKVHFWVSFVGAYAIFFPMLWLGLNGTPRRYFSFDRLDYLPEGTGALNVFITVAALIVGAAQLLFAFNLIWSALKGPKAEGNPWKATTLEWQTPTTPPPHGNWGERVPEVHRWPYDYSLPGAPDDFVPQTVAEAEVSTPTATTTGGTGAGASLGVRASPSRRRSWGCGSSWRP